jgi:hypothetical protein
MSANHVILNNSTIGAEFEIVPDDIWERDRDDLAVIGYIMKSRHFKQDQSSASHVEANTHCL